MLKVTLEMLQGRSSWTESHYYLSGSTIPAATPDFIALANARAACLGSGAYLTAIRLSEVPANRIVEDIGVAAPGLTGTWPTPDKKQQYAATLPNVALLMRLQSGQSGAGSSKSIYLACPPTINIGTGLGNTLNVVIDGSFDTPLGSYMKLLTGSAKTDGSDASAPQTKWGYRSRANGNPSRVTALAFDANTPPNLLVTTLVPVPGITAGNMVWLSGFRRTARSGDALGGAYFVNKVTVPVSPATSPYVYSITQADDINPAGFSVLGTIQQLEYVYPPYGLGYSVVKAVTRKRGGSLGAPRGRSVHRN
jgi:hypothetical protein